MPIRRLSVGTVFYFSFVRKPEIWIYEDKQQLQVNNQEPTRGFGVNNL